NHWQVFAPGRYHPSGRRRGLRHTLSLDLWKAPGLPEPFSWRQKDCPSTPPIGPLRFPREPLFPVDLPVAPYPLRARPSSLPVASDRNTPSRTPGNTSSALRIRTLPAPVSLPAPF